MSCDGVWLWENSAGNTPVNSHSERGDAICLKCPNLTNPMLSGAPCDSLLTAKAITRLLINSPPSAGRVWGLVDDVGFSLLSSVVIGQMLTITNIQANPHCGNFKLHINTQCSHSKHWKIIHIYILTSGHTHPLTACSTYGTTTRTMLLVIVTSSMCEYVEPATVCFLSIYH